MLFDYQQVFDATADQIKTAGEVVQPQKLERAIGLCLDDFTTRLSSRGFLASYQDTVDAAARTFTATGEAMDMKNIYLVRLGLNGAWEKPLTYRSPERIFSEDETGSQVAGTPSKYTILTSVDGWPLLRFNCELSEAMTIEVYYFVQMTPQNITRMRSQAVIVMGAAAYYLGITKNGAGFYSAYQELSALARATDDFRAQGSKQFEMNEDDKDFRQCARDIQLRRR